ncbi:MAG: NAD-binding protein [Actinomycetia bacterium]|nr:NAD-binding protein [Actinomycetes bacterium]
MSLPSNLKAGIISLVAVVTIGAAGFVVLTGIDFGNAVYLTIIVITTLGLGDPVIAIDGATKVWLVVVLISGMGAALYTVTAIMEYGFEIVIGSDYRRRNKMNKDIKQVADHVIVCGFGRVGSSAASTLRHGGVTVLIVERDPEAVTQATAEGYLVVTGDATRDEILNEARIDHARSVVACVASSSDNLVITLSAKALCTDINVYARASDMEYEKKLALAGADAVVTPEMVGGQRIAALAGQSGIVEFVDTVVRDSATEFRIKRLVVEPDSPAVGRSLADLDLRREGGAMVIGISRNGQPVQMNPDPHSPLTENSVLFSIGTVDELDHLSGLIGAR